MADVTPVYLIFGIPGSQRRDVIFDLIEGGRQSDEAILYFKPKG